MGRRGTAELPLHTGSAPGWLFGRMVELGGAISEVIIEEYGQEELLQRLADPYWFQALGCVLGFDWHSSGVTTTTMGALKEAFSEAELGLVVVGGKGTVGRNTPAEIDRSSLGLSGGMRRGLKRSSRMSAAVDNGCVQDSYSLYHHTMAIAESGEWCVVQQGMNEQSARRYHWLSDGLDSFVAEPQAAICTQKPQPHPLDLTARSSADTREASVDLAAEHPIHLKRKLSGQRSLAAFATEDDPDTPPWVTDESHLRMPRHHRLRTPDISTRAIDQLERAYEYQPSNYEELVALDGVGPASLRALALIAEVVHGTESSRADPAKYAYAHGGKDGTPYPVARERYDRSIAFMREMIEGAEIARSTRQASLARLASIA